MLILKFVEVILKKENPKIIAKTSKKDEKKKSLKLAGKFPINFFGRLFLKLFLQI
jgi:hypothetical protein